jgi:hypothetical protein
MYGTRTRDLLRDRETLWPTLLTLRNTNSPLSAPSMSCTGWQTPQWISFVAIRGIEPPRGISTKSPHESDLTPISQFELPSGIEPNYLDYKSSASPAMLWKQIMYQFHTVLLGTIRASRTRCTTQPAIMCYQLLGFHHFGIIKWESNPPHQCMPTLIFIAHLIHCTPYGARTRKLSRERGVS